MNALLKEGVVDGSEKDRSAFAMGAAAAVANGSITNRPAFSVGDALELMNPNATDDDVFLALAKHVPALSSPVGGSPVGVEMIRNRDLNAETYRNGWVCDSGDVFNYGWKHSDIKDKSCYFVYKLYNTIVKDGGLK